MGDERLEQAQLRAGTHSHVDSVTYLTCNVVYQEDPSLRAMMKCGDALSKSPQCYSTVIDSHTSKSHQQASCLRDTQLI
jgi:hypothetical protein